MNDGFRLLRRRTGRRSLWQNPGPTGDRIHLSVVATSRNDDHGGSLIGRMQHFVDGLVEQCRRHDLAAELILVEWNPPADRPPLVDALRWPDQAGPCSIRIITVPRELHAGMAHAANLPLFQMIAKNVGIRRAQGDYVLATNIDILFSDQIVRYVRDHLRPGRVYRADRCDVPAEVPAEVPFDQILEFCHREMFRINARGCTWVKRNGRWRRTSAVRSLRQRFLQWIRRKADSLRQEARICADALSIRVGRVTAAFAEQDRGTVRAVVKAVLVAATTAAMLAAEVAHRILGRIRARWAYLWRRVRARFEGKPPFTNACGDFTLLSRNDWFAQRGYPEWEIFSWHLDSVLLYQALGNGLEEVYVGRSRRIFHVDHDVGSGYTPEGESALFGRLDARGIGYITWPGFQELIADMSRTRKAGKPVVYNPESWGMAHFDLPETIVRSARSARSRRQQTVA